MPIKARNEVAGVLAVSSLRPGAFDAEHLHLFEVIARRTGVALESARLYHETQKANRLKDEFVAIVSHELRTPLTPILGAIYKLRGSRPDDADLQTSLDMIERNAKGQARIVEELLEISRITTGKLDFNREPTDLLSIIQSAIDVVRPSTEALSTSLNLT